MRILTLAVALLAALMGAFAPRAEAAGPYLVKRHRNVDAFDAVYRAFVAVANTYPELSRDFNDGAKSILEADFTIDHDLNDAWYAWAHTNRSMTNARYRDLDEVKSAAAALIALSFALKISMGFEIGAVEDRVDQFVALNPDKNVDKQRAGIQAARDLVDPIDETSHAGDAFKAMRKALGKLKNVKTFPYVVKPPKKKCGNGLTKGELAEGSWGLYDFDEKRVLPTFFRANRATVTYTAGTNRIAISFGYCNGVDRDLVDAGFSAPATLGTHALSGGGLGQGFNSICCSLTASSTVTFTTIDVEGGVVEGTFLIRNNNIGAGGPGRFLLRIDTKQ